MELLIRWNSIKCLDFRLYVHGLDFKFIFCPVDAVNLHTLSECLKITECVVLKCEYTGRI